MGEINNILECIKIPKIIKVKQKFNRDKIIDVESEIKKQLEFGNFKQKIKKGRTVAITAGSRGIGSYEIIMKTIVNFVKENGGIPFIVPAMGSHGGGNSKGQKLMLEKLGITEESMGCEIKSSMEVIEIGKTIKNLPVYIDKNAFDADGIILINRVKSHTSFRGKYESGLIKMLAIGLGKRQGADITHSLRFEKMAENIEESAKVSFGKLNILFGLATVENAYGEVNEIEIMNKNEILEKEPILLKKSKELMGRLYFDNIDVLIVKSMGKSISGTGMDTNVIGRYHTKAASGGPNITKIGVLSLSKESNGNANGIGLADFTTRKLYNSINFESTYMNAITSTEPNSIKIPMILDNDKYVLKACAKTCGIINYEDIKLIIIENTKNISEIYMSKAAYEAVNNKNLVETIGDYFNIEFDNEGNLLL